MSLFLSSISLTIKLRINVSQLFIVSMIILLNVSYFHVVFHVECFQQINKHFVVSWRNHNVDHEIMAWFSPEVVDITSLVIEFHQCTK